MYRQGCTSKEKHANHLDKSTGPCLASFFNISHNRTTCALMFGSTAANAVKVNPQPRIRRNLPWSESELSISDTQGVGTWRIRLRIFHIRRGSQYRTLPYWTYSWSRRFRYVRLTTRSWGGLAEYVRLVLPLLLQFDWERTIFLVHCKELMVQIAFKCVIRIG